MKSVHLQTPGCFHQFGKQLLCSAYNNSHFQKNYAKEIKLRKALPFTNIERLSKNINIFAPYTKEIHRSNDFYGHATILKKYLKLNNNYQFKFVIEHGITLDNQIVKLEQQSPFHAVLVSSLKRKHVWEKTGYQSFAIGPYIFYANCLLNSQQIQNERKRLGKNLLIFPSHSTPDVISYYDVDSLCKHLLKIAKHFDTIRICLYWKDILRNIHKKYLKYGFEIVTAGHVLDPNFLPRLKSIIKCSTSTMSNDIGSYTGYCIMLGRPHYIFRQDLKLGGRTSEIDVVQNGRSSTIYKKLLASFSVNSKQPTKAQLRLIKLFWGLDHVKNKHELLKIVNIAEDIYQKG